MSKMHCNHLKLIITPNKNIRNKGLIPKSLFANKLINKGLLQIKIIFEK